jgi:hypothetical protein
MPKFVKLGKKAASFADPYSELTLAGEAVKKLTPRQQTSPKILRAIQGGHLLPASKEEYDNWEDRRISQKKDSVSKKIDENKKLKEKIAELEGANKELQEALGKDPEEKTPEEKLKPLNKGELAKYYEETYEVSEEEVKLFGEKNKDDMILLLVELEKENEGKDD